MTTIGFLHPGQMGASLAATATGRRIWAGDGRSEATEQRAAAAGLENVGTLEALCAQAEIVVSICPPAAAAELAAAVADLGYNGIYVDANAISPATSERLGTSFPQFVDGGVIGPPAVEPGITRMYLAGSAAASVASLWEGSMLDVRVVAESAAGCPASALKMAYAGWTKGQAALLLAINAYAASTGVLDSLRAEWDISQPGLTSRSDQSAPSLGQKAWRFSGEMEEIAASLGGAGLPTGFHGAAAELYHELAEFKDGQPANLDQIVDRLLNIDRQT